MAEAPAFPLGDGEYGQLSFLSVDIAGSEQLVRMLSSQKNRDLLDRYKKIVQQIVENAGGVMGGWQGDGAVGFFGTRGDEDPLIRRSERAAREILEKLFSELPSLHVRIGLDTRPARFFADVGRISSEGAVSATRLQTHGRKIAQSSLLLISQQVYAALDEDSQKNYTTIEGPSGNAWLHSPSELASFLSPASPFAARTAASTASPALRADKHLWEQDKLWPFSESRKEMSLILTAQPLKAPANSPSAIKAWIQDNYLKLPLSGRVFEDGNQNRSTYFTVGTRGGPFLQFCRFYEEGAFAFGDASWSLMPGWTGAFFPESMWLPVSETLAFLKEYYRQARLMGELRVALMIRHIEGCERKMAASGTLWEPYQYREAIYKRMDLSADSLWPQGARELYSHILLSSGIPQDAIQRLIPAA